MNIVGDRFSDIRLGLILLAVAAAVAVGDNND